MQLDKRIPSRQETMVVESWPRLSGAEIAVAELAQREGGFVIVRAHADISEFM